VLFPHHSRAYTNLDKPACECSVLVAIAGRKEKEEKEGEKEEKVGLERGGREERRLTFMNQLVCGRYNPLC
jgi:hypothetical protein